MSVDCVIDPFHFYTSIFIDNLAFIIMTALLRYGVFDEFGFSGDQEYPNYFTVADRSFPSFKLSLLSRSTGMSINL